MKKTFSILALIFAVLGLIGAFVFGVGFASGILWHHENIELVVASLIATIVCGVLFEGFNALSKNY